MSAISPSLPTSVQECQKNGIRIFVNTPPLSAQRCQCIVPVFSGKTPTKPEALAVEALLSLAVPSTAQSSSSSSSSVSQNRGPSVYDYDKEIAQIRNSDDALNLLIEISKRKRASMAIYLGIAELLELRGLLHGIKDEEYFNDMLQANRILCELKRIVGPQDPILRRINALWERIQKIIKCV